MLLIPNKVDLPAHDVYDKIMPLIVELSKFFMFLLARTENWSQLRPYEGES
jgi:hypothetical protein